MTDKSVLMWMYDLLGCGTVNEKRYKTPYTVGLKKQCRLRCQIIDAYYVCLLIHPYAHVKIESINKIIKHYSYIPKDKLKAKVIDIANYKIERKVNEKNFNINSLIDVD